MGQQSLVQRLSEALSDMVYYPYRSASGYKIMSMSVIRKKITPEYFELIESGQKKFEIRVADFKLHKGDILVLEEYNPQTQIYTGRKIEKKVGYLLIYPLNIFGQKELIEKYGLYGIGLEDP